MASVCMGYKVKSHESKPWDSVIIQKEYIVEGFPSADSAVNGNVLNPLRVTGWVRLIRTQFIRILHLTRSFILNDFIKRQGI